MKTNFQGTLRQKHV